MKHRELQGIITHVRNVRYDSLIPGLSMKQLYFLLLQEFNYLGEEMETSEEGEKENEIENTQQQQ